MEHTDSYLLRPAEVIEMLGVSRSWLYDAAKSGRIPCVRLGGAEGPVRFRPNELDAWVEQGRVVADEPAVRVVRARPSDVLSSRRRRPMKQAQPGEQLRLVPPHEL
jgi:excisionase family DNA binding protein